MIMQMFEAMEKYRNYQLPAKAEPVSSITG